MGIFGLNNLSISQYVKERRSFTFRLPLGPCYLIGEQLFPFGVANVERLFDLAIGKRK
jgi:hypothetical protein